jgi:threonine dehydrogenase-like Zn-dependent dehydrogenase
VKCIAVVNGRKGPQLLDLQRPEPGPLEGLLRTLETGIDGTDEEIIGGGYGEFPSGAESMILGHEALAEVVSPPGEGGLEEGRLVVPTVRRGCGLCTPCRLGWSDFCETGLYGERGIKGLHGFMAEYFTERGEALVEISPDLRPVAVLVEPLSIAEKTFEEALEVQDRLPHAVHQDGLRSKRVMVVGMGALGILTALLAHLRGGRVLGVDRSPEDAPSSRLLRRCGVGHANSREVSVQAILEEWGGFDVIVEATGAPVVPFQYAPALAPNAVMVLLGVPGPGEPFPVDGAGIMRRMVLCNQAVLGSVNSNVHHFRLAVAHLRELREEHGGALEDLISHRLPAARWREAFDLGRDKAVLKRVLDWSEPPS